MSVAIHIYKSINNKTSEQIKEIAPEIKNISIRKGIKTIQNTIKKIKSKKKFNQIETLNNAVAICENFLKSINLTQSSNKTIKESLFITNSCLESMYINKDKEEELCIQYYILTEEIWLTSMLMNQKKLNYKDIINKHYKDKYKILEQYLSHNTKSDVVKSFLCSSGMGAIFTAIKASHTVCKDPFISIGNYFEIERLFKAYNYKYKEIDELSTSFNSKNIVCTMNTSDTEKGIKVDEIIKLVKVAIRKIKNENEYVNLIVDITIENESKAQYSLNNLLQQLKPYIDTGKVNLMLPKSFQKYSQMSITKYMSGNLLVINNNFQKFDKINNHLKKEEKLVNIKSNKEHKAMLVLLKPGLEQEQKITEKLYEKSEFLKKHIRSLYTNPKNSTFVFTEMTFDTHEFLSKKELLIIRDSFGFMRTSTTHIHPEGEDPFVRFSIGWESKERLIEKLYFLEAINNKIYNILMKLLKAKSYAGIVKKSVQCLEDKPKNSDFTKQKIFSLLNLIIKAPDFFEAPDQDESPYEISLLNQILMKVNINKIKGLSYDAKQILARKKLLLSFEHYNNKGMKSSLKNVEKLLPNFAPEEVLNILIKDNIQINNKKMELKIATYLALKGEIPLPALASGIKYMLKSKNYLIAEKLLKKVSELKVGDLILFEPYVSNITKNKIKDILQDLKFYTNLAKSFIKGYDKIEKPLNSLLKEIQEKPKRKIMLKK